jgi:hypothetical protein
VGRFLEMNDLNINELQEKINMVSKDIESLRQQGASNTKIETLSEYKVYLEEEINQLKLTKSK